MKNYKKITITGPFVQDILFPIDELGFEMFNDYMISINKLVNIIDDCKVKVKDVSYKKIPKCFVKAEQSNILNFIDSAPMFCKNKN